MYNIFCMSYKSCVFLFTIMNQNFTKILHNLIQAVRLTYIYILKIIQLKRGRVLTKAIITAILFPVFYFLFFKLSDG